MSRDQVPTQYSLREMAHVPLPSSSSSSSSSSDSHPPPYASPNMRTPSLYANQALLHGSPRDSRLPTPASGSYRSPAPTTGNYRPPLRNQTSVLPLPYLLSNAPEKDDKLHHPGPPAKRKGRARMIPDSTYIRGRVRCFSSCGVIFNFLALFALAALSVFAFMGYPLLTYLLTEPKVVLQYRGAGPTVPFIKGGRGLIDADTPQSMYRKTGVNGEDLRLVFSDEFNVDGRTFYPGEDPFWEAVDMHYFATGDLEYYDPKQIITANGSLVITTEEVDDPKDNHDLQYVSGMLQSWNKFCFTGGLIEASISLPGKAVPGEEKATFWSAFWIMGNLGRPGYRATTEGMWPYTYDTCDEGTLPNQTSTKRRFSYLPGQRLSACTCQSEDHPGPTRQDGTYLGRGSPELDVFEAQNDHISQSTQCAPFNEDWDFRSGKSGQYEIQDKARDTYLNNWKGNEYQQAASGITKLNRDAFQGSKGAFDSYGIQYSSSYEDGYITWLTGGEPSWTLYHAAYEPDPKAKIGQRLITTEPMSIVLNVAISEAFGGLNEAGLRDQLPGQMKIDWLRVYQEEGLDDVGCDTYYAPTSDYIADHMEAYTIWNYTTWEEAGYSFPKNRLVDVCT